MTLGGKGAPGAYDELMIWDRVLSPEEIALLVSRPERVAGELDRRLPRRRAETSWPVRFGIHIAGRPVQTIVQPGEVFRAEIPVRNPGTAPGGPR